MVGSDFVECFMARWKYRQQCQVVYQIWFILHELTQGETVNPEFTIRSLTIKNEKSGQSMTIHHICCTGQTKLRIWEGRGGGHSNVRCQLQVLALCCSDPLGCSYQDQKKRSLENNEWFLPLVTLDSIGIMVRWSGSRAVKGERGGLERVRSKEWEDKKGGLGQQEKPVSRLPQFYQPHKER